MGDVTEFRSGRAAAERQFDMGVSLGQLGHRFVKGDVEDADAVVVVVLRNDAPPEVAMYGQVDADEEPGWWQRHMHSYVGRTAAAASRTLDDITGAWMKRRLRIGDPDEREDESWQRFDSWSDYLAHCWTERRKRRDEEREAEAQRLRDNPWICDHCERRFATERGALQHERSCRSAPCRCGHHRGAHPFRAARCTHWVSEGGSCPCEKFDLAPSTPGDPS